MTTHLASSDLKPGLHGQSTGVNTGAVEPLTATALISVDYIVPPPQIAPFVTTLYHFTCDELVIRDIQPAAVGQLCLFPYGTGEMHFAEGHRDPNHAVGLLTPLSRATPIVVAGPFHPGWLGGADGPSCRTAPRPAAARGKRAGARD